MEEYWLCGVIGQLASGDILNILTRAEIHILQRTSIHCVSKKRAVDTLVHDGPDDSRQDYLEATGLGQKTAKSRGPEVPWSHK